MANDKFKNDSTQAIPTVTAVPSVHSAVSAGAKHNAAFMQCMTDTIPAKVCFVCTGNTCRSPMAEAVYNHFAKKSGVKSYAVSAGLDPREHDSINARAAAALESRGIEVPDHFAVEISDDIMRGCDKIIGITEGHMMRLILLFPYAAMKISAFPENVSDPWGGDLSVYEECLDTIIKNIKEMFGFYD